MIDLTSCSRRLLITLCPFLKGEGGVDSMVDKEKHVRLDTPYFLHLIPMQGLRLAAYPVTRLQIFSLDIDAQVSQLRSTRLVEGCPRRLSL